MKKYKNKTRSELVNTCEKYKIIKKKKEKTTKVSLEQINKLIDTLKIENEKKSLILINLRYLISGQLEVEANKRFNIEKIKTIAKREDIEAILNLLNII